MPARTGQEYLEGIRQRQCTVWFNGERVNDVVRHPALAHCAGTLAHLYDMQYAPATRDVLTYLTPETCRGTSCIIGQPLSHLRQSPSAGACM